jgi:hypothetical protein
VWCGGGGFFTDNNTTPTKVVLSCFGLLVGLWQLSHLCLGKREIAFMVHLYVKESQYLVQLSLFKEIH